MTNAESYLKRARYLAYQGQLNDYEAKFISSLSDYSKKDLSRLTRKQFALLRKIAEKEEVW